MHTATIYCDGSSIGNPGPGGWGATVSYGEKVIELGGFDAHTTNNRMELTAAMESLRALHGKRKVLIHTDSQYVINGITKWVFGWEKNDWQTKEKKDVLNKDLWQELVAVSRKHEITWQHVRGHEGVLLNERVDVIANGFARKENVTLFVGVEKAYETFLEGMPKARKVTSTSSKKRKGVAYSYVSLIEGKTTIYKTWDACEKAVKGKKAKYKKVFSNDEETALIQEWRA